MATAAKSAPSSQPEEKVRQTVGRVTRDWFDETWWRKQLEIIDQLSRGYRVENWRCPKCEHRQIVTVQAPDPVGSMRAAIELMEQAEGGPGTHSAEEQGK